MGRIGNPSYSTRQSKLDDPLGFLGRSVTDAQVRAALAAGGRLRLDHPFLQAMQVVSSRLTADPAVCDGYVAAAVADFLRDELFAAGQSLSFETAMSHRSKVDFFARARAAGYQTYLYFVATESPQLNVYRVRNRAALGGHDVPENKIVERCARCLGLLEEALAHAHRAFLFDNSGAEPVWFAQLTPEGVLELKVSPECLPAWFSRWGPQR